MTSTKKSLTGFVRVVPGLFGFGIRVEVQIKSETSWPRKPPHKVEFSWIKAKPKHLFVRHLGVVSPNHRNSGPV